MESPTGYGAALMYRILVVDEEPEVLAMARLFLEQDGEIVADTAPSPVRALAKMEVTAYDAVVSDYLMPEMDGIAFLREVRERFGDVPFIIMTAYSREEVVIEALNGGATGYLQKCADMKGTFMELIHLVGNAAGKRDAERALAESEDRFNDIIENAHDLIHSVRPDGSFILVNRSWRETLGYREDEIASMTVFDMIAPETLGRYMEMFSVLMHGSRQEGFETVFLAKDGRRIPVQGNINCLMAEGIPIASRGIFHVISGPGAGETDMHSMFAAIHNLPLPIIFTDRNGVITQTNCQAQRIFEEISSPLMGMDVRGIFADPACWDRITSSVCGSGEWYGEVVVQPADGDGFMHTLCCAAACSRGGVPGVYSVAFPGQFSFVDADNDIK